MRRGKSTVASKDTKVYHENWCPYVKKIKDDNKWITTNISELKEHGYHECSFCHKLPGIAYYYHAIENLDCIFDRFSNSICVKTDVGFWKAVFDEDELLWHLYHMNNHGYKHFDPERNPRELIKGSFHRQKDLKPQSLFESVLNYIMNHDKSKKIILDDYRKLPKKTKQQKRYYNAAKKKVKRNAIKNVYRLLDKIKMEETVKEK